MDQMNNKQMNYDPKQAQLAQQKQEEMLEQRRIVLKEFMSPEARERLSRLALVKPEKAQKIEDVIIQNVSMGTIKTKIDEPTLISYIEQFNEVEKPQMTTIKYKRKVCDSDDDFDF